MISKENSIISTRIQLKNSQNKDIEDKVYMSIYISFKQNGTISTLSGKPLKLED